jgi:hypothetical protein
MLAISSERFPQIGQPGIRAMLVDEAGKTDAALSLASVALDFEQVEFADKLAERD